MADDKFCETPVDLIKTPPGAPKYSTSGGVFDGNDGYPKRAQGTGHSEKIFDGAIAATPTDETRNVKA